MLTNKQFATELLQKLENRATVQEISEWAYSHYLHSNPSRVSELDPILLQLVAMEEGPEFEFSHGELEELAHEILGMSNEDDV